MITTGWLDTEHRADLARADTTIAEARRVLSLPCWPRDYLPSSIEYVVGPAGRLADDLEREWQRVATSISTNGRMTRAS